ISNAIKFSQRGKVTLRIQKVLTGWNREHVGLNQADAVVAFSVIDTGIGIPVDKQKIIFEAFQQADGTTSRKYGGTGLGLSISREIARMLGGEIHVQSAPGQGSTFTFFLPRVYSSSTITPRSSVPVLAVREQDTDTVTRPEEAADLTPLAETPLGLDDDRNNIQPDDRVLLIVEDDIAFVEILVEL